MTSRGYDQNLIYPPLGPVGWAPMSEQFGRRWLTVGTFFIFCIWTMACALAPNWPAFLVFRLFVGVFAGAPIAIVTGIMADMYGEPRSRGRAMAVFMVVCPDPRFLIRCRAYTPADHPLRPPFCSDHRRFLLSDHWLEMDFLDWPHLRRSNYGLPDIPSRDIRPHSSTTKG